MQRGVDEDTINTTLNGIKVAYYKNESEQRFQLSEVMNSKSLMYLIIVPAKDADLTEILNAASNRMISIMIIGDYKDTYPQDIYYYSDDYYILGKSHATSLLKDKLDPSTPIQVFYFNDEFGNFYINGFISELDSNVYNIEAIPISGDFEGGGAVTSIEESIEKNFNERVDKEIVTYSGEISTYIFNYYLDNDYVISEPGYGTGIRVLPSGTAAYSLNNLNVAKLSLAILEMLDFKPDESDEYVSVYDFEYLNSRFAFSTFNHGVVRYVRYDH